MAGFAGSTAMPLRPKPIGWNGVRSSVPVAEVRLKERAGAEVDELGVERVTGDERHRREAIRAPDGNSARVPELEDRVAAVQRLVGGIVRDDDDARRVYGIELIEPERRLERKPGGRHVDRERAAHAVVARRRPAAAQEEIEKVAVDARNRRIARGVDRLSRGIECAALRRLEHLSRDVALGEAGTRPRVHLNVGAVAAKRGEPGGAAGRDLLGIADVLGSANHGVGDGIERDVAELGDLEVAVDAEPIAGVGERARPAVDAAVVRLKEVAVGVERDLTRVGVRSASARGAAGRDARRALVVREVRPLRRGDDAARSRARCRAGCRSAVRWYPRARDCR